MGIGGREGSVRQKRKKHHRLFFFFPLSTIDDDGASEKPAPRFGRLPGVQMLLALHGRVFLCRVISSQDSESRLRDESSRESAIARVNEACGEEDRRFRSPCPCPRSDAFFFFFLSLLRLAPPHASVAHLPLACTHHHHLPRTNNTGCPGQRGPPRGRQARARAPQSRQEGARRGAQEAQGDRGQGLCDGPGEW